jgi:hypothetical protein
MQSLTAMRTLTTRAFDVDCGERKIRTIALIIGADLTDLTPYPDGWCKVVCRTAEMTSRLKLHLGCGEPPEPLQ